MTALHDAPVLIVFADLAEKHCSAGWYAEIDAARARLKGTDLGLTLIENFSEQLRAFALTLPRGRFLSDGKLHLDLVNREVIDCLLALRAADQPKGESGKPQRGQVTSSSPGEPSVSTSRDTKSTPASAAGMAKTEGGQRGIGRWRPQRRQGRPVHRAPLLSRARRYHPPANRRDRRKPLPNLPISSTNSGPRSPSAAW